MPPINLSAFDVHTVQAVGNYMTAHFKFGKASARLQAYKSECTSMTGGTCAKTYSHCYSADPSKEAALSVARDQFASEVEAATDVALLDGARAIESLKLAHQLEVWPLVHEAAARIGDAIDPTSAPSLLQLVHYDEKLKQRVLQYIAARVEDIQGTSHWRDCVTPQEKSRILAIAAARRADPLGLSKFAAHADVREVFGVARDSLAALEHRLQEGEQRVEAQAACAAHGIRALDEQRHHIAIVKAYVTHLKDAYDEAKRKGAEEEAARIEMKKHLTVERKRRRVEEREQARSMPRRSARLKH